MKKILLFDFDGTIADSFEHFVTIVNTLAEKHNFRKTSSEDLEALRSEGAKNVIKALQIPLYKIPFIAINMKQLQQEQIATIKPFTDLPEVLHQLKKNGYLLGILTSNGKENVELFLKNNNLDIFDYLSSDTSIFGKAKAIRNFLKQHNLQKEHVLYVGDEIRDIDACKKVAIEIIAVTWGFNSKKGLQANNPDHLIDSPSELLKVLNDV